MNKVQLKAEIKQIEGILAELLVKYNAGLVTEQRYDEYTVALQIEKMDLLNDLLALQEEELKARETSTATEQITITVEDIPQAATHNQLTKYMELCAEKSYMPRNTAGWTTDIASKEIQKLLAHRKMSDKQVEMIRSLQAEAFEAELITKTLSDVELTRVSADKGSEAIGRLISLLQQNSDKLKPQDTQVERIANMYPCPDVAWEDYNIEIMKVVTDNDGNTVAKRRVTRKELETQIKNNMSRYEAAKFISDFEPAYFDWKKTLISDAQIKQVRTLEKRLYNLSSPRSMEATSDIWGDIVDTTPQGSSRDTKWTVDLEEVQIPLQQLRLFTYEEARQLIAQLNIEIKTKGSIKHSKDEPDFGIQQLDSDVARNEFSVTSDKSEFEEFNNLLFSMQAIAGYSVDEFQDEVARVFFSEQGEGTAARKEKLISNIEEFIEIQLETKALSATTLVNMTEKSNIGRSIVKSLARKHDSVFEALVYA